MYVRGYLQGTENGQVVTIGTCNRNYSAILGTLQITSYALGV
jgi:hypothetical protein